MEENICVNCGKVLYPNSEDGIREELEIELGKLIHYVTVEGRCFDNPLRAATNQLLRFLRAHSALLGEYLEVTR